MTLAEALIVAAVVQRNRGDLGASIDGLRAAVDAADLGRTRVDAWIELSFSLQTADRFDDAAEVLDRADAALATAPDPVRAISALTARGTLLGRRSDYAGAVAVFERVQALSVDSYGPDSWQVAAPHANLAVALRRLGRSDEAIAHGRRAVELFGALGAQHPRALLARRALAQAMGMGGRHAEAEQELRALLEIQRRRLGDEHPDVAELRGGLAVELHALERDDEAEALMRAALAVQVRVDPDGKGALNTRANLAELMSAAGRDAEAEPLHRAVLASRLARFGPDHVDVAASRRNLGNSLRMQYRFKEAAVELKQARAILVARYGANHPDVANIDGSLAQMRGR